MSTVQPLRRVLESLSVQSLAAGAGGAANGGAAPGAGGKKSLKLHFLTRESAAVKELLTRYSKSLLKELQSLDNSRQKERIVQKRMSDMLLAARDRGLYRALTDNGAGGLSSSFGEMARECGGIRLDLERAPLKYPGLAPWEILLSEAQERMSLAVPPARWPELQRLAAKWDVEVAAVGKFTADGSVDIRYAGSRVGLGGQLEFVLLFRSDSEDSAADLQVLRDLLYAFSAATGAYELEVGIRNGATTTVLHNRLEPLDQVAVSAQGNVIGIATSATLLRRSFQLLSGETLAPSYIAAADYAKLSAKMKEAGKKKPPAAKSAGETARFLSLIHI